MLHAVSHDSMEGEMRLARICMVTAGRRSMRRLVKLLRMAQAVAPLLGGETSESLDLRRSSAWLDLTIQPDAADQVVRGFSACEDA